MSICDKLIDLRIVLTTACDGFSVENGSKDTILSTRTKVLHLLSGRDMTPAELIDVLGVAKSNLANLSKSMIEDGVIESYKNADNMRNVYYRVCDKGLEELRNYKKDLSNILCGKLKNCIDVEENIDRIIMALRGE